MKKLKNILIILTVLYSAVTYGQSNDQNWVKTKVYKTPTTTPIVNPTIAQAAVQVNYYDGLGRPIQSISQKQSATGKNILQHIAYDTLGRQKKEYLPITNGSTSLDYQTIEETDIINFYTPSNGYEATNNPYSEKQYENSPLNRVLKQAAPGNVWAMGTGHEIKMDYQSNTASEVKQFDITTSYQAATKTYTTSMPVSIKNYGASELYKNIMVDENNAINTGNQTEEFTNKQGQVVLKRIRTNKNGVQETYDTYYIYEEFGNLSYVIPPLVDTDQPITTTILNGLCYQYQYDKRNRLVAKKIPSKQWEYIVYDKLDRVRATGPAKSPFNDVTNSGWLLTKYDSYNRPILTAWQAGVANANTRVSIENQINSAVSLSETKSTRTTTIANVVFNYTTESYPTSGYHILTVNYYDDYNYPNAPTNFSQVLGQEVREGTNGNTKGLSTGTWVRILENSTDTIANKSYTLYKIDRMTSAIATKINYPNGGYTKTETEIDFEGKATRSITTHKRDTNGLEVATEDTFTYTNQGQLLNNSHTIDGGVVENIVSNSYKKLGELKRKDVGSMSSNPLQRVDYRYNIRGWLTDINAVEDIASDGDLFAFKIKYDNPTGTVSPLYNGNISETYWRTSSDDMTRKYEYGYDGLNRLKDAHYTNIDLGIDKSYDETLTYDKNGNITWLQRYGGFENASYATSIDNLTYIYDPNNLNQLKKVVDLTNSTQGFKDDSNGSLASDTSDDYSYDQDGNMTKDENKHITNIKYNHLNLPTEIQFTNGRKINYTYDATGLKRKKKVQFSSNANNTITTDYLEGYQYETQPVTYGGRGYAQLLYFPTAEGYVKAVYETNVNNTQPYYQYVYNYTDHLGNIRMSYTRNNKSLGAVKLEETHYYPFGLKHGKYNNGKKKLVLKHTIVETDSPGKKVTAVPTVKGAYKYKYNGKELQDELGLNVYDYGARFYDPATGRWFSVDAMAEKYKDKSTYNYAFNNPIIYIDPDGNQVEVCCWDEVKTYFSKIGTGISNRAKQFVQPKNLASMAYPQAASYFFVESLANDPVGTVTSIAKTAYNNTPQGIINNAISNPEALGETMFDGAVALAASKIPAAKGEVVDLGSRAKEIHSALPKATQTRTTTAVAEVANSKGKISYIVGSSEKRLRPAQRAALNANETAAVGMGHAEATAINAAKSNGQKVLRVGASRPICSGCQSAIKAVGAEAASTLKKVKQ